MSAFVEVDYSQRTPPFADPVQIYSITEGSFGFDKDYEVFDALAGGRQSALAPDDRDRKLDPRFPPKGMPVPQSLSVAQNFFYLVAEANKPPNRHFWPEHRCIPPATADDWVKTKGCFKSEVLQWFNCRSGHLRWQVVADPCHYNASWLWLEELDAALSHHGLELESLPVEYVILRSAMSLLERRYGPKRVRLVVWFS